MLLTLYYVTATWMQSWKLRSLSARLCHHIAEKMTIVFYTVQNSENKLHSATKITSDLCSNSKQARIADLLWLNETERGAAIVPKQIVGLSEWITFPSAVGLTPNFVPVHMIRDGQMSEKEHPTIEPIHLLVESELIPNKEDKRGDFLRIEQFGQPLAWKADSHLAVILQSDIDRFTELIMSSIMQGCLHINDNLPLLRIETVTIDGIPQRFESLTSRIPNNLTTRFLVNIEWEKHVEVMRAISKCKRTETSEERLEIKIGTTIQPDLIPSASSSIGDQDIETDLLKNHSPARSFAHSTPKNLCANQQDGQVTDELKKFIGIGHEISVIKCTETITPKVEKPKDIEHILMSVDSPTKFESVEKEENKLTNPCLGIVDTEDGPLYIDRTIQLEEDLESENKYFVSKKLGDGTFKPEVPIKLKSPNKVSVNEPVNVSLSSQPKSNDILPKPIVMTVIPTETCQTKSSGGCRPTLQRSQATAYNPNELTKITVKPPNILVYSDSSENRNNVIDMIGQILNRNTYTIYPLTHEQAIDRYWMDNACLLIVCGTISSNVSIIFSEYFLNGGRLLSLCSDSMLHLILPTYRTAEVRESELVQFSYDRWHNVKMMHHIFCYQPSPIKKHFSTDSEDSQPGAGTQHQQRKPNLSRILMCPRSVEMLDQYGRGHTILVRVLGTEETWNTPSLMLATSGTSGGKAVFSQVHLEVDPTVYQYDDTKYAILKQSNSIRLEILTDLLISHLDVNVETNLDPTKSIKYKSAFFLGRHELKFQLLDQLKEQMCGEQMLRNDNLTMTFYGKNCPVKSDPSESSLPILIHACPDDFSTVDYFDNLKTEEIGRVVIYAPIVTSSMNLLNNLTWRNGLAVIARHQTKGAGRHSNKWLSPEGCAMFSLQLHIPLTSPLGRRIPLIQHLVATAVVHAIVTIDGLANLNIGLKWPNDIYANGVTKIGGLIITSQLIGPKVICNIGCGLNVSNSRPTLCLNDLIAELNERTGSQVAGLDYERTFARIFTEIERILLRCQNIGSDGDIQYLYNLYYKYWLHSDTNVKIIDDDGKERLTKIIGIDDYGYLKVDDCGNQIEVHPDGNSFDMLRGLIIPKKN